MAELELYLLPTQAVSIPTTAGRKKMQLFNEKRCGAQLMTEMVEIGREGQKEKEELGTSMAWSPKSFTRLVNI